MTGVDPLQGLPRPIAGPSSFADLAAAEVAMYMQSMLLPDADGFSMCSSVELRVPFVDVPVFAAAAVGQRRRRRGKGWFAQALDDPYLQRLASAPKRGFAVPMARWMASGPLRPHVEALTDPDALLWRYVDRTAALAIVDPPRVGTRWSELWSFAALNAWLEGQP
jgi:asparagine synthase (glutamine-hydrolysing)